MPESRGRDAAPHPAGHHAEPDSGCGQPVGRSAFPREADIRLAQFIFNIEVVRIHQTSFVSVSIKKPPRREDSLSYGCSSIFILGAYYSTKSRLLASVACLHLDFSITAGR